jgi:hypothetical protein
MDVLSSGFPINHGKIEAIASIQAKVVHHTEIHDSVFSDFPK